MAAQTSLPDVGIERGAEISEDGLYRYRLWRRWDEGPPLVFVMLNPSTADAEKDDPTIRRCLGFARRENAPALLVVNLFAFRATDPADLLATANPGGGSRNYEAVMDAISTGWRVVAAWGAYTLPLARLHPEGLAEIVGRRLYCLGVTKYGDPRHPLYMPADSELRPWPEVR